MDRERIFVKLGFFNVREMNSVPDLDHLDSMKSQKRQISTSAAPTTLEELGILNISEIHFRDDENW